MIRVRTVLDGWPGAPGLNTFYFDEDSNPPDAVAQDAFTRVHEFWTAVAPLFPDEFTATTDQLVDQIEPTDGSLITSFAATGVNVQLGTNTTSDFLPAQTNAVLSLRTGDTVNGERVKGRSYIGPMAASTNASNGQMTTAAVSVLAAAGIDLFANLGAGGFQVVWHRPTTAEDNDGSVHAVIDTLVRPVWAHLKSRRQ